ncbi:unnamed protein product [Phytophthora fragariaefolia]|uniref:Unnamed protein product n=1 Tax=Phytophthora fragariaefolia TaxID=1490495 RepID=A0A9W6U1I1_9STRA|nr:unnamed protein product [Phytophthora fragariaefolia]
MPVTGLHVASTTDAAWTSDALGDERGYGEYVPDECGDTGWRLVLRGSSRQVISTVNKTNLDIAIIDDDQSRRGAVRKHARSHSGARGFDPHVEHVLTSRSAIVEPDAAPARRPAG